MKLFMTWSLSSSPDFDGSFCSGDANSVSPSLPSSPLISRQNSQSSTNTAQAPSSGSARTKLRTIPPDLPAALNDVISQPDDGSSDHPDQSNNDETAKVRPNTETVALDHSRKQTIRYRPPQSTPSRKNRYRHSSRGRNSRQLPTSSYSAEPHMFDIYD
jgi:hypothetical protein